MSEKKPYKQFNLPSGHLPTYSNHAKPMMARDPEIIDFRKSRKPGELVLDQQRKGLIIASRMTEILAYLEVDDGGFTSRMLAVTGLNTSFYNYARYADVMDRRLDLPQLVIVSEDGSEELRASEDGLVEGAVRGMKDSVELSTKLLDAYSGNREGLKTNEKLGKKLGNTSLLLGFMGHIEDLEGMDAFDAQGQVRKHLMELADDARTMATMPIDGRKPIGSHPSMLQFADADSDLSVFWRRHAPRDAANALDAATSEAA